MPELFWALVMPLHFEQVAWMPSPPLAPDDGTIDIAHLRRMTLDDESIEREVLVMFAAQAAGLIKAMAASPSDAAAKAHTLRGSAQAIGAFHVAGAAERMESAIGCGGNTSEALAALNEAVTQARNAIDEILRRS